MKKLTLEHIKLSSFITSISGNEKLTVYGKKDDDRPPRRSNWLQCVTYQCPLNPSRDKHDSYCPEYETYITFLRLEDCPHTAPTPIQDTHELNE